MCMTPIRSAAPMGAIGVYWKDFHETTEEERLLLKALADSCSIAMENVSLQTELRARLDQIVRLNRLKDEFLRNLSHELRTPLNIILGWTQLLASGAEPEEFAEGIELIEKNGRRQEQIIKDLLDCSDLISGQIEFEPSTFDLGSLIEPVLDALNIAIQAKKIAVRIDSLTTDSFVHADTKRCREVLWHLLSNAIKFTPKGGEIRIRSYRDESHSKLEIADNGIGITQQFLPKVFDLFTQEDTGITRTYSGTGLGLSIARYFTEAQGGSIEVRSQGKTMGTDVTLSLPVAAIRFTPKRNEDPQYMTHVFQHLMQGQ
ncbi:MAG: HAMP domain-containing histidine kinase [Cytophagaceae bacterium]|nr:MAG: HAMP domain-containing histidine kinase [Cytophagaceae bacterium]